MYLGKLVQFVQEILRQRRVNKQIKEIDKAGAILDKVIDQQTLKIKNKEKIKEEDIWDVNERLFDMGRQSDRIRKIHKDLHKQIKK